MIIDCHTRLWSDPRQLGETTARTLVERPPAWAENSGDAAALGRAMACVDASLVLGHRADLVGAHVPNELIADFVARDPRYRLGIAGIDPLADSAMQDLDTALSLGLVGVVVTPSLAGFHPTHSAAMRIFERCCERSMPVITTMPEPLPAASVLEFARPTHWDEVARALPQLRLLFTSVGYPWVDETLMLAGKHEHVYTEVSGIATSPWQLYNTLSAALSLGVMDRLLLGSGFPRSTAQSTIEALYSVNHNVQGTPLPPVPRSRVRQIVERNALSCLGIDAPNVGRLPADETDPTVHTPGILLDHDVS
ncbi:MAG: amidohydrolase family protein [Phycisphaerales bacterium]|jgi:hypothetical protein|nr:amidohydrolase family protein [Phycisphaerales bacterium]